MFPAINVSTVKLNECRRVVLFNFIRRDTSEVEDGNGDDATNKQDGASNDEVEDEEVEIRHYAIRAKPVGVDRKVRRLIEAKIPNLSKLDDISDYITGQTSSGAPAPAVNSGAMSDSEAEDETAHVMLPEKFRGKGNNKSQKSALKLVELGPRLRLKLVKVERGLASGDVMYHAYVHKTPEEVKELKQRKEQEASLKRQRREDQEANVQRKQAAKDEKKAKREQRKKEREEAAMASLRGEGAVAGGGSDDEDKSDGSEEETDSSVVDNEGGFDGEEEEEEESESGSDGEKE
jgi:ribosome biogenesis protein SSF1/2